MTQGKLKVISLTSKGAIFRGRHKDHKQLTKGKKYNLVLDIFLQINKPLKGVLTVVNPNNDIEICELEYTSLANLLQDFEDNETDFIEYINF